jgi:hypothetical protein
VLGFLPLFKIFKHSRGMAPRGTRASSSGAIPVEEHSSSKHCHAFDRAK